VNSRESKTESLPRPRKCSISAVSMASLQKSEVIKIQDINEAYERMLKSDVKYRFTAAFSISALASLRLNQHNQL
jgi:hypothetical protein